MKILLVDDEPLVRSTVGMFLTALGHEVLLASRGEELLSELARSRPIDAVITDLTMPGLSGLDLIRTANRARPDIPIIVMTGHFLGNSPWGDLPAGVFACLSKPFRPDELEALLSRLVESSRWRDRQAAAETRARIKADRR